MQWMSWWPSVVCRSWILTEEYCPPYWTSQVYIVETINIPELCLQFFPKVFSFFWNPWGKCPHKMTEIRIPKSKLSESELILFRNTKSVIFYPTFTKQLKNTQKYECPVIKRIIKKKFLNPLLRAHLITAGPPTVICFWLTHSQLIREINQICKIPFAI